MTNIWRLGQVRDAKFGMNFSNKILLNVTKYQVYSFYCYWVIGKNNSGGRITPFNQIRVNKLKSAIKNETKIVLGLLSNVIGNSDDEINFPHELLLTNG